MNRVLDTILDRTVVGGYTNAGYRIRKGVEDGVLVVEFPILPTDTSVGVMERREHRAESASVRRLLSPRRVVVYGKGDRVCGVVDSMLRGGFRGEVLAVTSDGTDVPGVVNAASIGEAVARARRAGRCCARRSSGCGVRRASTRSRSWARA